MVKELIKGLITGLWFLSSLAYSEVSVAPKHVVILQSAVDLIQGSYLFGVQNDSGEAQSLRVRMMFPNEVKDFRAEEGITADDLKLGEDGKVYLEKSFGPGLTLVGVSFIADASFGDGSLTFIPSTEIGEFSVLISKNSKLEVMSDLLLPAGENAGGMGEQYKVYLSQNPIQAESIVSVDVTGVPQGRAGLWIIGFAVFAVLLVLSGLFSMQNRKEVQAALS